MSSCVKLDINLINIKMDFEELYKEESSYDVGKHNIDNTDYYSEDYVKWLEQQLLIQRDGQQSELLKAFLEHIEETVHFFPCEPSVLIDDYLNNI